MDELAPLGPVYQAGTLSGNPLATAAGLAVLAQLDAGAYDALEATAERLAAGLRDAFADAGVAAQVTRAFTLVGVFFADAPVRNYDDARAADHARYARLLPRPARPRRVLRAERLRDAVPEPRPHRRRHRPDDHRGRRERAALRMRGCNLRWRVETLVNRIWAMFGGGSMRSTSNSSMCSTSAVC